MRRREFFPLMAAGGLRAQAPGASLTVTLQEELGTIRLEVYGHSTEHIGRQI